MSAACHAACPEVPGCSGALTGTRVLARSVGESTSLAAGDLGCSGCTACGSKSGSSGSSLRCWNRRRVGVSVAVSGLVTLVVLFGGDVLERRCSISVVAALMLPDLRFDFAGVLSPIEYKTHME